MRTLVLMATSAALLAAAAGPVQGEATAQGVPFKAAMIYNFARFATWPPTRFADAASPVVLCVSPNSPLAEALAKLEGQPVGERRLHVKLSANLGAGCHLSLVDNAETTSARLASLHQQGVLTIGETGDFRGAVTLVTVARQIRFRINTRAARAAGVVLSSQLLRLAIEVR
jgi:hypothetical protein